MAEAFIDQPLNIGPSTFFVSHLDTHAMKRLGHKRHDKTAGEKNAEFDAGQTIIKGKKQKMHHNGAGDKSHGP